METIQLYKYIFRLVRQKIYTKRIKQMSFSLCSDEMGGGTIGKVSEAGESCTPFQ